MFLLYADDSGSAGDASQEHFVLGGVAIPERQPHWISVEVEKVAARFDPADPRSVELHGSPMLTGRAFWRHFPLEERVRAMQDALRVFATSYRRNVAFAVAVRKAAVAPQDPVEVAFEELCRRFDHFLMRFYRRNETQRGLIVFDESTRKTRIQQLANDFRTVGHSQGRVRNLAEVPLFVDSRASRMVQLADLVAYSVFRSVEKRDDRFLDVIRHRFDEYGGIRHGLHVVG